MRYTQRQVHRSRRRLVRFIYYADRRVVGTLPANADARTLLSIARAKRSRQDSKTASEEKSFRFAILCTPVIDCHI